MLEIAIQVRLGRRKGDPTWVDKIISYIFSVRGHLSNYCMFIQTNKNRYLTCKIFILASGKKILEYIWKCQTMIPQYNWTFGTGFMRPFINPNYLVSKIILIEIIHSLTTDHDNKTHARIQSNIANTNFKIC
jgi:hypothetical protein